jgi:hypothetical protein
MKIKIMQKAKSELGKYQGKIFRIYSTGIG